MFEGEMLLGRPCVCCPLAVGLLLCKQDRDKLMPYRYEEVLLSTLRTVSEATSNDKRLGVNYQQTKSLNEGDISVSFHERAATLWDAGFLAPICFSLLTEGRVEGTRGLSEVNALVR